MRASHPAKKFSLQPNHNNHSITTPQRQIRAQFNSTTHHQTTTPAHISGAPKTNTNTITLHLIKATTNFTNQPNNQHHPRLTGINKLQTHPPHKLSNHIKTQEQLSTPIPNVAERSVPADLILRVPGSNPTPANIFLVQLFLEQAPPTP